MNAKGLNFMYGIEEEVKCMIRFKKRGGFIELSQCKIIV